MEPSLLAIYCESSLEKQKQQAWQCHQQLDLPLLEIPSPHFSYLLVFTDTHLELRHTSAKIRPIYVDFLNATSQYRSLKVSRKNELIAKAVGIKGREKLSIIDATAGLGQDAFILSSLGCSVHCLERSPAIAALLQDGIDRFSKATHASLSLSLTTMDAICYLKQLDKTQYPDVIYLDPMFPSRTKSALVKKEMRMLRDMVGEDLDASELFELALQRAKKRVVVKRSKLAPMISAQEPDLILKGSSSRFDVYFTQ